MVDVGKVRFWRKADIAALPQSENRSTFSDRSLNHHAQEILRMGFPFSLGGTITPIFTTKSEVGIKTLALPRGIEPGFSLERARPAALG
jgi:hypothetical protein